MREAAGTSGTETSGIARRTWDPKWGTFRDDVRPESQPHTNGHHRSAHRIESAKEAERTDMLCQHPTTDDDGETGDDSVPRRIPPNGDSLISYERTDPECVVVSGGERNTLGESCGISLRRLLWRCSLSRSGSRCGIDGTLVNRTGRSGVGSEDWRRRFGRSWKLRVGYGRQFGTGETPRSPSNRCATSSSTSRRKSAIVTTFNATANLLTGREDRMQ